MPNDSSTISEMFTTLVRQSVAETVQTMCGAPASFQTMEHTEAPCDGLCGIVSFVGDLSCCFMLALPRQTALDLTLAFTGFEMEFDSAEMADAVGEFVNILGGDLVARLEHRGTKAAMSLPTVARGRDVQWLLPHDVVSERLSFRSPAGDFWLTVAMARPAPHTFLMPGEPAGPRTNDARGVAAASPSWQT